MKKAFITGITGQDGSYLSELLLERGYEVHGLVRRVALEDALHRHGRILHIKSFLKLHSGTLESYSSLIDVFEKVKPDECYHLGGQSYVHESFEDSFSTFNININGTLQVLSALRQKTPGCKFYFAASSEMFGKVEEVPQTEKTRFHPRSPYGVSKVTGYYITQNFREAYNLFACSGILFNHESPRRGSEFISRKITSAVARIANGKENVLELGNVDSKRDWGFSGDYVLAMWLMLQQDQPDDYVVATGETNSVRTFVDMAFQYADLKYESIDLHELSVDKANEEVEILKKQKGNIFVVQHPMFYRPAEVDLLLGDATKVRQKLGWKPQVSFEQLVQMMVENDLGIS